MRSGLCRTWIEPVDTTPGVDQHEERSWRQERLQAARDVREIEVRARRHRLEAMIAEQGRDAERAAQAMFEVGGDPEAVLVGGLEVAMREADAGVEAKGVWFELEGLDRGRDGGKAALRHSESVEIRGDPGQ